MEPGFFQDQTGQSSAEPCVSPSSFCPGATILPNVTAVGFEAVSGTMLCNDTDVSRSAELRCNDCGAGNEALLPFRWPPDSSLSSDYLHVRHVRGSDWARGAQGVRREA